MKILQNASFFLILIFISFLISSFTFKEFTQKSIINNGEIEKQTSIIITKNTSLEDLEKIKKKMKDEGFDFYYSNVVYNEVREIISISISYKDANNNSGNYSVASEKPINDIIIISNGNKISVRSEGNENKEFISPDKRNSTSNNTQKMMEDRNAEMAKRKVEMENNRAERMQEMKQKQTKMRARMEHKRDSLFEEQRIKSSQTFIGNYNIITKNTTNAELLALEKKYQSENISFSYDQLERNAADLITHISIKVNNGEGSISKSSFGNSKDPITDISIGVDSENIIMKNAQ